MKSLTKSIIVGIINTVQTKAVIPLMRWASTDLNLPKPATHSTEYVEPNATFNASVIQMSQLDRDNYALMEPEIFQAELNGLMEALRADALNQGLLVFFAGLMAQGYPPDECMRRTAANNIHLGMFLQKRMENV